MSIKILLADDHQIVRQGLRTLLEKEPDLEVVAESGKGQTAIQLAQELSPDIVILDLALPDFSGTEAIRQVLAAAPQVKVIALSLYTDRRVVVNVLKAGAAGYLVKDRAFEEMAEAVRAVNEHKTYISPGLAGIVVQDYLEALRESEARFRTIFAGATIGIALVDLEGRIVESNPALQGILGYSQEELHHKAFTDFAPKTEGTRCPDLFRELMAGKRDSYQVEKQYVRRDGTLAWGRLTVSPFRDLHGETQFAIGMLENISEQKEAEGEIRNYQEHLRSIASELVLTEERERRRLATDLHDYVGQILALAQIKLGALREEVSSTNLAGAMDEVRRLIEQTIQYTRSLSFELSPPILYDLGFEAAVEWLAEMVQSQNGVVIKIQSDRSPKPMEDEIRILLFQAVRELLQTMVKQSKAKSALISIGREGTNLQVRVEGDGVGVGSSPSGGLPGFGLFSIEERIKHLGGQLQVSSTTGAGSSITLVMPLKY